LLHLLEITSRDEVENIGLGPPLEEVGERWEHMLAGRSQGAIYIKEVSLIHRGAAPTHKTTCKPHHPACYH